MSINNLKQENLPAPNTAKTHNFFPILLYTLGSEWVDPDDPTAIAEAELLGAANSIEAAAKKLSQLQPRKQPKVRQAWCVTCSSAGSTNDA